MYTMFNTARVGVQSARLATAAGAPTRAAAAPLFRLPPRSLSSRGVAQLARRSLPHGARGVAVRRVPRAPFLSSGAAAYRGAGSAAGGGDKGGPDSGDGDSSDDEDGGDDDEDAYDDGSHKQEGDGRVRGEGAVIGEQREDVGVDKAGGKGGRGAGAALGAAKGRTLEEEAEALGVVFHGAEGAGEEGAGGGGERVDYRTVGSEIFEDGDVEAGETLRGMYDFVDDIVETQHVPTIRDPFDSRGKFHRCRGKKQGKAALEGTCEIFNAKELHINNAPLLKRFVNDAGMVLGRSRSGLCAKCQRKVSKTIKSARQMGLVPTVSEYRIRDTGPGGLLAWAGEGGNHDAQAKAKALAEAALRKNEKKRFGSLV